MTVEEWLGKDNQLGIDIWHKKYQYNNETFSDWIERISGGIPSVVNLILDKKFLFGGRILANRGLPKQGIKSTYSNCYVLTVDDNIESIYQCCSNIARTYSYGGGVGIDISKLRPKGAKVNNSAKETTGACSFMPTFDLVTSTIGQQGRRGALMISIDINHPDVEEFIDIKANTDKITNANISVKVNDKFMTAVIEDKDYILKWPCDYNNEHLVEDSLQEYNKLYEFTDSQSGKLIYVKKIKAKDLFNKLVKNNWEYGEPGILFWDKITSWHMMSENPDFQYAGVNPCLTGDMMIKTNNGSIRLDELVKKYENGETITVASYNTDTCNIEYKEVYNGLLTRKNANIIQIEIEDGTILKLTPDHKVYTENRGWVEAGKLTESDILLQIN